jgi:hypothetical protein
MRRRFFAAFCCLLGASPFLRATPQIWFTPMDPIVRPPLHAGGAVDYMALFAPDAPWPRAAAHIQVFSLYPQFVGWGSDADLVTVFRGLAARHIALAAELGMFAGRHGVEGCDGDNAARYVRRIKRLGGDLRYIAMDEPLYFGHEFAGKNSTRVSIPAVAANVAANIAAVRQVFPDVQVGDVEPLSNFATTPGLLQEMSEWIDAFQAAAGRPLAFVRADLLWTKPWQDRADGVAQIVRSKGLPFGIIYDGDYHETSDAAWLASARGHYEAFESGGRPAPDEVAIQTWMPLPTHVLPETSPTAFTHLVDEYVDRKPAP